jgi:signal peptidase I
MEQDNQIFTKSVTKKLWIAVLLTLIIPGLGHFYIGQTKRAIKLYLVMVIYTLAFWFLPLMNSFIGLILIILVGLAYYFYIIVNVITTFKINKGFEIKVNRKWYVYFLIILAIVIPFRYIYFSLKDRFAKFQFAYLSSTAMSPSLTIGDKFAWKHTKRIDKNDIVMFEFPGEPNSLYAFRCVGFPGERLEIKQGRVYINGKLRDSDNYLKFQYNLQTNGARFSNSLLKEIGIDEFFQIPNQNEFGCNLTLAQKEKISKIPFVTRIVPHFSKLGIPMEDIFPYDTTFNKWNCDFYGPITLPKKGETISIKRENAILFYAIIQQSENLAGLEINSQGLLELNGVQLNAYTFKHNYYFMLGDNRHSAWDSRYRGFVSEDLIKGKALYLWWSKDIKKIGDKL